MPLEGVELPPPRLDPPASLGAICRQDAYERVAHSYGKSYRDVVRAFRGRFDHPPDVVAHPRDEAELEAVLAWCADAGAAAIPFGGGTSVVGGVEPRAPGRLLGAVSVDLKAHGPRARGGHGLVAPRASRPGPPARASRTSCASTASPFGTSRSRSSTRRSAAGSPRARAATSPRSPPTSTTSWSRCGRSRRAASGRAAACPGSGAGPSPDRLLIGSEGVLGVITEAWVRVQAAAALPRLRRSALRPTSRRAPGGARARPVRPPPVELPPARPRRGRAHRSRAGRAGRCSCSASSRPTTRSTPGSPAALELCGDHGGRGARRARHGRARRVRGRLARRLPPGALPARHARGRRASSPRPSRRPSPGIASTSFVARSASGARRGARRRTCSPAVSRTPTPTAPRPTSRSLAPARRGSELEQWARAEGRGVRGHPRRGRHDHPPPRGRPRSPALVRPPASRAVRRGAPGGEGRAGPCRDPQSRRARGSAALALRIASATSSGRTR